MIIGAQLYSVRSLLTDEKIDSTFAALSDMGYKCVQFSGAPIHEEVLARVSGKYSLPVVLTHSDRDKIFGDPGFVMAQHAVFNCRNIGNGWIPREWHETEEALKKTCDMINAAAKKYEEKGYKLFYHHHHFEFEKLGDKTKLDIIMESCPSLNLTLDVHWAMRGGVNPLDFISRYAGRLECVHLKDFAVEKEKPVFAPVGEGNLNWDEILPALEKAGAKYALVEQDDADSKPDPLGELAKSARFLHSRGY